MAKIEIIVWKSDDEHCPPGLKYRAQCMLNGDRLPVIYSGSDGEALRESAQKGVEADLEAAAAKQANYRRGAEKRKAKAGGVEPPVDTPAADPAPATADDDLIL